MKKYTNKFYLSIILCSFFLCISIGLKAQEFEEFLVEDFEVGYLPDGWALQYTKPLLNGVNWIYENGGHTTTPSFPSTRKPYPAHSGTKNALFYYQSAGSESTILWTKPFSLELALVPELTFWHAQDQRYTFGNWNNDQLRVYYKRGLDSAKVQLAYYPEVLPNWTERVIIIPDSAFSPTFYIGFEAITKSGWGACVDDISIVETATAQLSLNSMTITQPSTLPLTTGLGFHPIAMLTLKVSGNAGTLPLESLKLKVAGSDLLFNSDGFNLFTTQSPIFYDKTNVGTSTSIIDGEVLFDNITLNLLPGYNYLWITCSVKNDAPYGASVNFYIPAEGVQISSSLYPVENLTLPSNREVRTSFFYDNFESDLNWELIGNFQVFDPIGQTGGLGNPDPVHAYNGIKVLGTPGAYPANLLNNQYLATSPIFDLTYFKNVEIQFARWLNIEYSDKAKIQLSKNAGVDWTTIYENTGNTTDSQWQKILLQASQANRSKDVMFRFTLGPTDDSWNFTGWNIDDVAFTAYHITKDVGVVDWIYPLSGCGHSSADSVIVKVANLGDGPITQDFPISYSFNGGTTWITDIFTQDLAIGDTVEFIFPTKVDLSLPGLKPLVMAKTALVNDEDSSNDLLSTSVFIAPTYPVPYSENFESNDGFWRSYGTSLWAWGSISKPTINAAVSGTKGWITDLTQSYGSKLSSNYQIVFNDGFETNKNWIFTGEFERNVASHPLYPYDGLYFIGNDISGQGANLFGYENGILYTTPHAATSPPIDISNYHSNVIEFYGYIRVLQGDTARILISPNNGATWVSIWDNNGVETLENWYSLKSLVINDQYSNSTQLRVRFAITHSSIAGGNESGWIIDQFSLKGKTVNNNPSFVESACYNLTGINSPIFETNIWTQTEAGVDGASLYYSINKGVTWNNMNNTTSHDSYWNWYSGNPVSALGVDGWSGLGTGWKRARHLLPAAVANETCVNFRIGFAADKLNNNYDGIAIDDVKIYEAPHDFGITNIVSPASACDLTTSEPVTITLKNFGVRPIPSGQTVTIGIKSNRSGNIEQFTENITLTSQLAVGATVNIPLVGSLNMNISGEYNIEAFTISEIDPFFYSSTANDTTLSVVEVMKPFVDLGSDIYTVHPDTITFDVTNANATSYLWQDASTDPIFSVTSNTTATYSVTLSNAIPCTAYDEVLVVKLNVDLAISEIVSPISNCELTNETSLVIEVINLGTDTLLANRPITLGYEFDGGGPVEVGHNLSETLYPDSVFRFTFAELFDLSQPQSYPIRVWVTTTDDETPANNEVSETVTVYGYPIFDLSPDSVYLQANSYVVDAGAGYNQYLWHNDGSTEQTFTADSIGWVYATVSDINGCSTTDSIYVHLKYRDVIPLQIITPVTSCGYESPVLPSFVIKNNGTDTLFFSTTVVNVGFQFEGGAWVEEEAVLTQDIYPNDTFIHTFSQEVDVTVMGDYSMIFKATTDNEMRPENDELNHNISVFTIPNVSLGNDIVTRNAFWVLDAGAGFEEYLWSTNETTQTITVTQSGTYSVTVTNNEICSDTDEVQVTFLRHDYGISTIVNPISGCSQVALKTVLVRFSNLGNDTLQIGQTINFGYKLNQNQQVVQNYITTFKLTPGFNFLFTFTQQVNITEPNEYTIKAWAKNIADVNVSNDSLVKTVNTYALPFVDLGPEYLWVTFPYVLNSNVTDVTYLWNTGSTEPSITAEEVGKYWVRVTNSNSCIASDTINLRDETSIEEIPGTSTMVSVYPNPSSNFVKAEISTTKQSEIILEVFSSTGQFIEKRIIPVTNSVVHTIDVTNYSSGIYLLRFTEGKKYTTIRLGVTH